MTHRLKSTEAEPVAAVCGDFDPGDTLAARPFPLTCLACIEVESDGAQPKP